MSQTKQAIGNRKRVYRLNFYRVQNIKIGRGIQEYCRNTVMLDSVKEKALKFSEKIFQCASYSLFRKYGAGDATYHHSLTCKAKMCMVCNSERKNRLRTIFREYFQKHEQMLLDYDFMHLTLTVPHTIEGWRGKYVYNKELLQAFNYMRKEYSFWKRMVWAGMYSIECTKNENGLHIHLHSLLLVHKSEKNRNELYREILRAWNACTVWSGTKRKEIDANAKCAMVRGIAGLKATNEERDKAAKLVDSLNAKGSTLVGLTSLYELKGGKRVWCSPGDKESMTRGIMECLKYHFEPVSIYKDDASFNYPLLIEMLCTMHGQRLYGKFGAFHGDKELNLKGVEDLDFEDVKGSLSQDILHPETGEITEDYTYGIYDLLKAKVNRFDKKHYSAIYLNGKPKVVLSGTFQQVFSQFNQLKVDRTIENSRKAKYEVHSAIAQQKTKHLIDYETGEILYQSAFK